MDNITDRKAQVFADMLINDQKDCIDKIKKQTLYEKKAKEQLKKSYFGTEVLNNIDIINELYQTADSYEDYSKMSELLKMAAFRINTMDKEKYMTEPFNILNRCDESFLKLGECVNKHNMDKVQFIETCLIEEMSELTKSICKHNRNEGDVNNTIEELGHVILMCYALINKHRLDYGRVIHEAELAVRKMYDQDSPHMTIYVNKGRMNK
mgnify:CR=1 FL=1